MTPEQEKELIHGIRLDERAAVEKFVVYFYNRILLFVRRKIGKDTEDCRDLANEIIWKAIVKVRDGSYDEEKGRLMHYVHGITMNCCLNFFKAEKKNPHVAFSDLASSEPEQKPDFLDRIIGPARYQEELQERLEKEIQSVVVQAIAKLDAKHKELIYLMYYQQLSYEEISQKEKLPLSKVKSRLFEARRELEQLVLKKLRNLSNF